MFLEKLCLVLPRQIRMALHGKKNTISLLLRMECQKTIFWMKIWL